jgi:hypothetical protein
MKTILGSLALACCICGCAVTPSESVLNDQKPPAEQRDAAAAPCVEGAATLPPCNNRD